MDVFKPGKGCNGCHEKLSKFCNKKVQCVKCHGGLRKKEAFLSENYLKEFVLEKRDPHGSGYLCPVCHNSKFNLKRAKDEIALCEECHNRGVVNLLSHSYDFVYYESNDVSIPENFPLKDSKVVCSTCHKFVCLRVGRNNIFLRGDVFSLEGFCFNCHDEKKFHKYNPHHQIDENGRLIKSSCLICHTEIPDVRKDKTYKDVRLKSSDINKLCNGCHQIKGKHPTGTNHLRVPDEKVVNRIKRFLKKEKVYVPFGENYRILCVTCHLPHQYELIKEQATGKYKPRTRFNTGKELCVMCHEKG